MFDKNALPLTKEGDKNSWIRSSFVFVNISKSIND